MSIRLFLAAALAAALSAASIAATHKEGANDVETTTWDYVDASGCHLHEDNARYTHLGVFVKNTKSISRICGTHAYTFHSTITATEKGRHKVEQSADIDPATCSSLTRSESGDYKGKEEIAGQRTITTILNGTARPPVRTIIRNGTWVTMRNGSAQPRASGAGCPVTPAAGEDGGYGSGAAMLPPYAGSASPITVHLTPGEGGAQGVLVLTEDAQHDKQYQRHKPDALGNVVIDVAAGTALVELVRRVDQHGSPEILSHATVGNPAHIPRTDVVAHPPSSGPSILEAASSAQPGDIVQLHIARNDPLHTQFFLDRRQIAPLGVSNNSAVIQIPSGTSLANHALVMKSGAKKSNALNVAIIRLTPEPVAPSSPGILQRIRVHVDGLAPGAQAKMSFEVGGAATMLDGGTIATVPVAGGIATVQIRGTHAGKALLRFHLSVKNPQFL